jgi:geranylgeranyl diphosphate synthase type I
MEAELANILMYKSLVDRRLKDFLTQKSDELSRVNRWGSDVTRRLLPFVVSGKTVRGSLVPYSHMLFNQHIHDYVFSVAASMELMHAGLLIHDDIMDRDKLRRGAPSIHEQYADLEKKRGVADFEHFGLSMGINAADLCFFMAFELLAKVPETFHLTHLVSRELQLVVIAQMQDVESGAGRKQLTPDSVMSLYRYKTARYTFSLSMIVGATLAGVSETVIQSLDRFGESLGLLYQIRDDELSVDGDTKKTGKPVGSDERNAKQTLQTLLTSAELEELKTTLSEHAQLEIEKLPLDPTQQKNLEELVRFCIMREK